MVDRSTWFSIASDSSQGSYMNTTTNELQVIKGEGRQGDFVHNNQTMGAAQGFRNVSALWLQNGTMSYEQGFELLAKHRAEGEDIYATVQEMAPTVGPDSQFCFLHVPSERFFKPTPFAMGKVGGWANCGSWYPDSLLKDVLNHKGEVKYKRDWGDADILVRVVQNGFRRLDPNKVFLWRVNKSSGLLRTMVSDRYACVDNEWFLGALKKILPGGRLSHWKRSDEETIFGNVLVPDSLRKESDSDYGGMLSVSNSQIGERDIHTLPSVFRAICRNGCIWDRKLGTAFRRRHVGNIDLDALFIGIKTNLEAQIPLLPVGIERLLGTRKLGWDGGSIKPLFATVAQEYELTKKQASSLLVAHRDETFVTDKQLQNSLFGVINAVTRAGQRWEKASDWVKADEIGGQLTNLDADEWSSLTSRAKTMKAEQVEEAFAMAN